MTLSPLHIKVTVSLLCEYIDLMDEDYVIIFDHNNHEEVFYIINGTGKIKIGNEEARLRDGDIIYIPENTTHCTINDGEEMLKFLAFGGYTGILI
ncbi:MAG TPA: cupin domain-containing protein [Nitrososphaeraceae archaeon]